MRPTILSVFVFIIIHSTFSQKLNTEPEHVYRFNYSIELPVTAGLWALNYYGFGQLKQKPTLNLINITSLSKNRVWSFDRRALYQDPSNRIKAHNISDWAMKITAFAPALLFIDRKIRQQWYDIVFLYLQTQAINSNLYTWGGPMLTSRERPFVYYEEIAPQEKMNSGSTDAFFSGHTAWTASASFFMAKIYSDYHPELGAKKFWLYAAALIPPAFVGFFRYKALKHFPTDIMMGAAVGAATGILIPHLHKNRKKHQNLSIIPYAGPYSGVSMTVKF